MQGSVWPLQLLADLPALTLNPRSHLRLDSQILYSTSKRRNAGFVSSGCPSHGENALGLLNGAARVFP